MKSEDVKTVPLAPRMKSSVLEMSLREHFAIQSMQGMLASLSTEYSCEMWMKLGEARGSPGLSEFMAVRSVEMADALLAELAKVKS